MSCKDNKHRHNKQEEIGYFSRRDVTPVASLNIQSQNVGSQNMQKYKTRKKHKYKN